MNNPPSINMSSTYSDPNCTLYVRRMEQKNISPMPFIGLYVAAASLLCSFAMFCNSSVTLFKLIGTFNIPIKIFRLNATWLTLLAVATKLTGDLTSPMWSYDDNLSKISSTLLLTSAMAQFFTLLGSMSGTDMLGNLMALSILVFTVLVDLCIQLGTGVLDFSLFPESIFAIALLFCMFIAIVCSALAIPAIKKRAESRHQTLVKQMEAEAGQHSLTRVEELRLSITIYWVMAASGSPQFLVTRLASFIFTNIISLFSALLIFFLGFVKSNSIVKDWSTTCHNKESDYKWSIPLIIISQLVATIVHGLIATCLLTPVMWYKYEDNGIKISRKEFTVEPYWTENLEELKQSPIPMRIQRYKLVTKFLHYIKSVILTFCKLLQNLVVVVIKFSCVVSFYGWLPLVFILNHLFKQLLPAGHEVSNDQMREETIDALSHFVILLEGEKQLPKQFLRSIVFGMNKYIQFRKGPQPCKLLNLLKQSFFYKGAIEFDSSQVPCLLSEEPLNCWTLPLMTLTSIAVALPNIAYQHVDELISSVDEGLQYASHIDALDENNVLKGIKNAASVAWVGVKLHKNWLGIDLSDKNKEVHSAKEIIQTLATEAERIVKDFSFTGSKYLVENPLYWPANVLAANSMYRISRTILLYYEDDGEYQAEELFRKLICMIANILTACLTNLPHVIATKCINNAFEERFRSVRNAAILFRETEDILKLFEERQLLGIGPSQPLCIDEWRRWMETQDPTVSTSATDNGASATDNGASSTVESNEIVIVQM